MVSHVCPLISDYAQHIMQYYIRVRGKAFGPFDENQLSEMKSKGKISRITEISTNRIDWNRAGEFDFLFTPSPSEPSIYESKPQETVPEQKKPLAEWFYSLNGTEGFGPVSVEAMVQMIQSGKLVATSYAWKQGQTASHLGTIGAFAGHFGALTVPNRPTPVPAQPLARQQQQTGVTHSPGQQEQHCSVCRNAVPRTATTCSHCGSPITRSSAPAHTMPYSQLQPSESGIGYFDVLKKYAVFSGRARRKEYWMFVLVNACIQLAFYFVSFVIQVIAAVTLQGTQGDDGVAIIFLLLTGGCSLLMLGYWLYVFIPYLAVTVRRLHDAGFSGVMLLLYLIPIVGPLVVFVFLVLDSQPDNQYGPNPKKQGTF